MIDAVTTYGRLQALSLHNSHVQLGVMQDAAQLMAQLRDAKRDASNDTVEALKKITCAIRKRFGQKVRVIVRADTHDSPSKQFREFEVHKSFSDCGNTGCGGRSEWLS